MQSKRDLLNLKNSLPQTQVKRQQSPVLAQQTAKSVQLLQKNRILFKVEDDAKQLQKQVLNVKGHHRAAQAIVGNTSSIDL